MCSTVRKAVVKNKRGMVDARESRQGCIVEHFPVTSEAL